MGYVRSSLVPDLLCMERVASVLDRWTWRSGHKLVAAWILRMLAVVLGGVRSTLLRVISDLP